MFRNLLCKKKINFSFLICITCSILLQACYTNPTEKLFEKQDLSNLVRKKAAICIEKQHKLSCIGTGAEAMNEIKMLALAFKSHRKIDIEEGRKLLVASVEILLDEINKEEKLRPYLANYPFEARNVEIRIFIDSSFSDKDLIIVKAIAGEFSYKIAVSDFEHQTVYAETYEEAVKKVRLLE